MCHDNCSHHRMDYHLLDDGQLSQAEETTLAKIELLSLRCAYPIRFVYLLC